MTSIFIAYSSKDTKIAESIQEYLEHDGFGVWRDKSRIEIDWSKEIAYALSRQDVALLLWSEDSSNSKWVKNEWITARALDSCSYISFRQTSTTFKEFGCGCC